MSEQILSMSGSLITADRQTTDTQMGSHTLSLRVRAMRVPFFNVHSYIRTYVRIDDDTGSGVSAYALSVCF